MKNLSYHILIFILLAGIAGCERAEQPTTRSSLPLLSERQDVWGTSVIPDDPPVFHEDVYWVEAAQLDDAIMIDGVFTVERQHPLATLKPGDVFVSDWEGGYWKTVQQTVDQNGERVALHTSDAGIGEILVSGQLVGRPAGTQTWANGLSSCATDSCSATVDLSLSNPSLLTYADAFGGASIEATEATLRFRPTLRYGAGVDRTNGPYTQMMMSGSYTMSASFSISAERSSSLRVSYPIPSPGSDSAALTWRSNRNPSLLEPEEPAVSVDEFAAFLESMPGVTVSYEPGPSLRINASEGAIVLPYTFYDDSDPINPEGGVKLESFVSVFNEAFVGTDLRAQLVRGGAGYSATVFLERQDPDNSAVFSLLGRRFSVQPENDIAFSATVSRPGSVESRVAVDGRVEAGWRCYEDAGCSLVGNRVYPETTAEADSTVIEGTPWIDFRFQMRPAAAVKRGGAPFAEMAPGIIKVRSDFETNPPSCTNRDQVFMAHRVSRLGRSFYTDDTVLVDETGVSNETDGCTGTGQPPGDCSICESSGTPNCVRNICGEGKACYFGKCSLPADYDVTMTWDFSEPNVDLDLWLKMPDGSLVHSGQLDSGPAKLANMSDGAISSTSEDAGGYCEGEADRDCADFPGVEGQCPETCMILREQTGFCYSEPTSCENWWRDYVYCPSECRTWCNPDVDPSCPSECFADYDRDRFCFECNGEFNLDRGCLEQDDEASCVGYAEQCRWASRTGESYCVGGRVRCETLDKERCGGVEYCTWQKIPQIERLEFPPYMERIIFNRAMTNPVSFWVVNKSGAETDEQIPFEIAVRLRDGVDYKIQGFVGPEAGSRSIEYRYELGESL